MGRGLDVPAAAEGRRAGRCTFRRFRTSGLVFSFHAASRVFPPENHTWNFASLSEHMVIAPDWLHRPGHSDHARAAWVWRKVSSPGSTTSQQRPETRGVISRLSMRIAEWIIALFGYIVYLRMRTEVREIQHEVEEDKEKESKDSSQESEGKKQEG